MKKYLIFCVIIVILVISFPAFVSASGTNGFTQIIPSGKVWYFNSPWGIAVDSSGNVYVVDSFNNCICKFDSSGIVLRKWGSEGNGEGQFKYPRGIALDSSGNVYVADTNNNRIQEFDSEGVFIKAWGSNGTGDGQFQYPYGIAVDSGGNVYVTDDNNDRIQKFDKECVFIKAWGSKGSGNSQFSAPWDIATDSSGDLYVADMVNNRIQKFNSEGVFIKSWGGNGTGDGQFQHPCSIAVDGSGYVYVTDVGNKRIQKFDKEGNFQGKWGSEGSGDGQFSSPYGIAVDGGGNVYTADNANKCIQKFDANGAFKVKWGSSGSGDGQLSYPYGIAIDSSGNLYVVDTGNYRIQKFGSNGSFLAKWGSNGTGDGQFIHPYGIAVDSGGNAYVADTSNNRIQKFDSNSGFIKTWGSNGSGDGQFQNPSGIALDNSGNVYVADTSNNRIQKFDKDGNPLGKWGSSGSGDGQFSSPIGIVLDSSGNVYVADTDNNRIQKFDSAGGFIKAWGSSGSGDGQFNSPYGIAVDSSGNVYVADTANNRIQEFDKDGKFLGKWGSNGTEDGQFNLPHGIALDSNGNVYVADRYNHRIQKLVAYTVSFDAQGGSTVPDIKNVVSGSKISAPAEPVKSGYTFGGWYREAELINKWDFSNDTVTASVTLYAKWTTNATGGGSTPSAPEPTYNANVSGAGLTAVNLPITVNKDTNNATLEVGTQLGSVFKSGEAAVINIPTIPGINSYTLGIPVAYLSMADGKGTLTFNSNIGSITILGNMFEGVAGLEGKKAEITIGCGNKSGLSEAAKAAIGDRPLIQLEVKIDGKSIEWNNPNAAVTISIPYKPTAAELENPDNIIIWYIDGNGNTVSVPNGHYDPATGSVSFTTNHFSQYAVGYNKVSFKDVAEGAWYSKAVGFIAARGITSGLGNEQYNPGEKLTRGQFIVMVLKAYGISPDQNPTDNFADSGNTYYTNYLATAKRLGISGGVGNNRFAPDNQITRQEMFVLLYNALKATGKVPNLTGSKTLVEFSDGGQVASWAKDAMTFFVQTGTISGNGGKLSPIATTSRAEMAQVLYNLLSK